MDPKYAKRLYKHESLTDILIQVEDFLDSLDLYVFANWIDGEIYQGPEVRRYWVDMTLLYPLKQMPDPQGAVRLSKYGTKVKFKKTTREKALEIITPSDVDHENGGKPKIDNEPVWLVELSIPRKFIEELDDDDLENIDDEEIDIDDVSDARDENIDQDDAYQEGSDNAAPDDSDDEAADAEDGDEEK